MDDERTFLAGLQEGSMFACHRVGWIDSKGGLWRWILYHEPFSSYLAYSVPLVAMQTSLVLVVQQIISFLLKPFQQPTIVPQILGGIVLGPSGIGQFTKDTDLFPPGRSLPLATFGSLGFILFAFIIGVKMDPSMFKVTGKMAMIIGLLSLIVPSILGICSVVVMRYVLELDPVVGQMLYFAAAAESLTSFPVIACLLTEMKILNSELGRLALSSALVSDLTKTCISTFAINIKIGEGHIEKSIHAFTLCIAFLLLIIYIVRPALFWVARKTPEGKPVKEGYIHLILLGVVVSSFLSMMLGLNFLFGPFILGLATPDGPPLGSTLVRRFEFISSMFLLPIYLTYSGLRTNLLSIKTPNIVTAFVTIVFISAMGKTSAIMLPCLYSKMPFSDSLSLAFILNAKGVIEMALNIILLDNQNINDEIFAMMVMSVLLSAVIVCPVVNALYDPSRKYAGYKYKTILNSNLSCGIRILVCIKEEENVHTIIKLLKFSPPSKESPVCIFVLHLIELVGRAAPILITHEMHQKSSNNYSKYIINAFKHYEEENRDAVLLQVFTSISPAESMDNDIYTLALEKGVSLIIIPFLKQSVSIGQTESEKVIPRSLNNMVLEKAPCSVAMVVDRWYDEGSVYKTLTKSTYNVAVLFMGGADDREALACSIRMAGNPSINLTVVRLNETDGMDFNFNEEERMFDEVVLDGFCIGDRKDIEYIEEEVRDGTQTTKLVLSIQENYDLIIVGRQQRMESSVLAGLTEWSEYKELGILGDLLASSENRNRASVLVIQQHKTRSSSKKEVILS
uniref:Cation/H(+) antiporter 15-like n=1 Tax=Nelumbo nucifera TaxID=4432 RepID=A0A822Z107_NELNU|nr:TPA_asm: hypothetical protein HUJ06_007820 [Nelumbo nucifera]